MSTAPIFDPELLARLGQLSRQSGQPVELIVRELLGAIHAHTMIPPEMDGHAWDKEFGPTLVGSFASAFGQEVPVPMDTARRKVAVFFAQRVPARTMALTTLFRLGMYSEAIPIVRSIYEDWLIAAHLLLRGGQTHCHDFWFEDQLRLLAKWYRGTMGLMPPTDADRYVDPETKLKLAPYLTKKNAELKPLGGLQWAQIATRVGLASVHECAYAHLSGLTHGSALNLHLNYGPGVTPGSGRPTLFQRSEAKERLPAFWAYWFSLRALTLAAREFRIDLESHSEDILDRLRGMTPDPVYCIAVREASP